jgi:hypothetical protein
MVRVSPFNHASLDRVKGHKSQPLCWGRNLKTLQFLPERRYPSDLGLRERVYSLSKRTAVFIRVTFSQLGEICKEREERKKKKRDKVGIKEMRKADT